MWSAGLEPPTSQLTNVLSGGDVGISTNILVYKLIISLINILMERLTERSREQRLTDRIERQWNHDQEGTHFEN